MIPLKLRNFHFFISDFSNDKSLRHNSVTSSSDRLTLTTYQRRRHLNAMMKPLRHPNLIKIERNRAETAVIHSKVCDYITHLSMTSSCRIHSAPIMTSERDKNNEKRF